MWNFHNYSIDELLRIQDAINLLSSYGVEPDPERMKLLTDEIQKRHETTQDEEPILLV